MTTINTHASNTIASKVQEDAFVKVQSAMTEKSNALARNSSAAMQASSHSSGHPLSKGLPAIMPDPGKFNRLAASENMELYRLELESVRARTTLVEQKVSSKMMILNEIIQARTPANSSSVSIGTPYSTDISKTNTEEAASKIDAFNAVMVSARSAPSSSSEICNSVADAIGQMEENYMDQFQYAVEKMAAFYSDLADVMSKLTDYVLNFVNGETGEMNGDIHLNGKGLRAQYQALLNKYALGDASILFPKQTSAGGFETSTREECAAWAKEMGLPESTLILTGGKWLVKIDTSPVSNILNSIKGLDSEGYRTFNSASWAAWQSGLDIQKDRAQTAMQSLTQKYSNANSTFDNLVKVLSSTIAALLDSDKQFFNI